MAEKTIDLRGLKCPLPALRACKALAGLRPGDLLRRFFTPSPLQIRT
jgi:TusA-related sulfurtransferase